jgi:hypothetical protein
MNRYCGIMKAKLKAVTAGHSLSEFFMLIGTAFWILLMTPDGCSPVRTACIPKTVVFLVSTYLDNRIEAILKHVLFILGGFWVLVGVGSPLRIRSTPQS